MKHVDQSAWLVMFQVFAATGAVVGLMCLGALLTALIDRVMD